MRSRATPEDVIASLPTGTFKEWKKDDSETRCPICLDDVSTVGSFSVGTIEALSEQYEPLDVVTKLIECPHWLHKNCLEVSIIGDFLSLWGCSMTVSMHSNG